MADFIPLRFQYTGQNPSGLAEYQAGDTIPGSYLPANTKALAELVGAADKVPYFSGVGVLSLTTLTELGRSLIAAATQGAQRTVLGLIPQTSAVDKTPGSLLTVGAANLLSAATTSAFNDPLGSRFLRSGVDGPLGATICGGITMGVTSAIEQQIAARLGRIFFRSLGDTAGSSWMELFHSGNVSAFVQTLFDDSDAAALCTTIGLGSADNVVHNVLTVRSPTSSGASVWFEGTGATIPDFSTLGFGANMAGKAGLSSTASLGLAFVGVGIDSPTAAPLGFFGYAGSQAPTAAPISFNAWKHNGATSRVQLATDEYVAQFKNGSTTRLQLTGGGAVLPGFDNTQPVGRTDLRWSVFWAGTGTISTSDAREKTPVQPLTAAELAAAQQLAGEIGTYQFLSAVAEKGAEHARHHVGMTVQRAIEILQSHGLDPFRYGCICHDAWDERVIENPAEYAEGNGEEPGEVLAEAYTEVRPAGDRYSFRMDELLAFVARGQAETNRIASAHVATLEQRLAAMEQRLAAMEQRLAAMEQRLAALEAA